MRWPDLLVELETHVDLVLCNPPYVPDGTPLPPEVTGWDPPAALYGGPDGLEIIRAVISASAALLRYGGALAIEHDDTHGEAVPALMRRRPPPPPPPRLTHPFSAGAPHRRAAWADERSAGRESGRDPPPAHASARRRRTRFQSTGPHPAPGDPSTGCVGREEMLERA